MEEIDQKFGLDKDYDFELRLFIFPKFADTKTGLSLFILNSKNGNWKARLFEQAWSLKNSVEIPLRSEGLDSLWKGLLENNVLNIPLTQYLVDKKGELILDQLESDNHSFIYTFELLTPAATRSYSYKCPMAFSKKYDSVPEFRKVANIVRLILKFCELEHKLAC
jgi:hypothetical protein